MGRSRSRKQRTASSQQPTLSPRVPLRAPPFSAACVALALVLASALPFVLGWSAFPDGTIAYWQRWGLGTIAIAALVAAAPVSVARNLPEHCTALLLRPRALVFAGSIALLATALSLVFALYAYELYPTSSDEVAQLWHARVLLTGRLSLPPDPNPEFFAIDNVVDAERWFSQYPIGGPAFLALGLLVGAPWLVNPVLTGLSAAAAYHFARRAYGEVQGRAIGLLIATTAMILLMGGSYMNHVPTLFLAVLTLAVLAEWDRAPTGRLRTGLAGAIGLLLGIMATVRPLDAVVLAAVVGTFQIWRAMQEPARRSELAIVVVGGLAGVAPLLLANWQTTGHALRFGYDVLWGPAHSIGFHPDPQGSIHTVERGFRYAALYVAELNLYVFLWPVPALAVAVLGLVFVRRLTRWDAVLLVFLAMQVVAYGSYWFWGQFLGPRFLFTALPTVVVLVARAPFLVTERAPGFAGRATFALVLASSVVAWTAKPQRFSVPGMAEQMHDSRRSLKLDLAGAVQAAGVQRGLVLLREPFNSRLQRRLWGMGMSRSEAAILLRRSDSCSLHTVLRAVEADPTLSIARRRDALLTAAPFVAGPESYRDQRSGAQVSSAASITPECNAEVEGDERLGGAAFGIGVLLQQFGPDGHIGGSVVYAADLGDRNEVLRERFGDRPWYRVAVTRDQAGVLQLQLREY